MNRGEKKNVKQKINLNSGFLASHDILNNFFFFEKYFFDACVYFYPVILLFFESNNSTSIHKDVSMEQKKSSNFSRSLSLFL